MVRTKPLPVSVPLFLRCCAFCSLYFTKGQIPGAIFAIARDFSIFCRRSAFNRSRTTLEDFALAISSQPVCRSRCEGLVKEDEGMIGEEPHPTEEQRQPPVLSVMPLTICFASMWVP